MSDLYLCPSNWGTLSTSIAGRGCQSKSEGKSYFIYVILPFGLTDQCTGTYLNENNSTKLLVF